MILRALVLLGFYILFTRAIRDEEVITQDSITKTLDIIGSYGIRNPKVVLAQTILETGYYKSLVFKENHNPFGMKHNKRGYSLCTKNGHAFYPHTPHKDKCTWKCYDAAFQDYAEWQKKIPENLTDEQYLYYLDHLPGNLRYAEDPEYTNKLKAIMEIL